MNAGTRDIGESEKRTSQNHKNAACPDSNKDLMIWLSGASTGSNVALFTVFGNYPSQFCTPLDFVLLASRGPYWANTA